MHLKEAQAIANDVYYRLKPHCERIEIVGSIRRCKAEIKDIDIVLVPSNPGQLSHVIDRLGTPVVDGDKLRRINHNGTQVDIYYATPRTWATLLLIRTGSTEFNRMLATRALKMGLKLKADGQGVMRGTEVIANESEEAILRVLKLPYLNPWEREIPLPRRVGS